MHIRTQTRGLSLLFCAVFLLAGLVHQEELRGVVFYPRGAGIGQQKKPQQERRIARFILTCNQAGLCSNTDRILTQTDDPKVLARLTEKGCTVEHHLRKQTSLRCPQGLALQIARVERVFQVQGQVAAQRIGATLFHSQGNRAQDIKIAVLDTGIDQSNIEFADRILAYENFTDEDSSDQQGHGTHIAGIAAGRGLVVSIDQDRMNRALGTAPAANLLIAKVCDKNGFCLEGDILAGIEWAVTQGANVINMSLGAGTFQDFCDTDPLAEKVNWAVSQGVSVIVAAGNTGEDGEGISTPGCASSAITVGAVDDDDARPAWSSFGNGIDVVAPGATVYSVYPCSLLGMCPALGYVRGEGTSVAAPLVSGVVALLLQHAPELTPEQIRTVLRATAKDLGAMGFDIFYGYGLIDTSAALAYIDAGNVPPVAEEASSSSQESSSSSSVSSASEQQTSSQQSSTEQIQHGSPDALFEMSDVEQRRIIEQMRLKLESLEEERKAAQRLDLDKNKQFDENPDLIQRLLRFFR